MNCFILNTTKIKLIKLIICLFSLAITSGLDGQCIVDSLLGEPIILESQDTINLRILIEQAELNQLDIEDQGVCEVRLEFIHQDVSDLNMTLYSPNSASTILVGPAQSTGAGLQIFGIAHDIGFVPSTVTPMPDPGLPERWDNRDPDWGNSNAYAGSYWPFGGDLDIDFNNGDVNGIWELVVADQFTGSLDPSVFESFEISFCNQQLICSVCEATSGSFLVDSIAVCEGQNILIDEVYSNGNHAMTEYVEIPISFSGNAIFTAGSFPAFEGEFEVYIITLLERQKSAFLNELSALNKTSVFELINQYGGKYCIDISEPIKYVVKKSSGVSAVVADTSVIGCTSVVTLLDGSASIGNDSTSFTWTNSLNEVISSEPTIEVSIADTYTLVLSDQVCTDSAKVSVIEQTDLVITDIESSNDTLNCIDTSSILSFRTDMEVVDLLWTGLNNDTFNSETLMISAPGSYILNLVGPGSCRSIDTIRIVEDIEVATPNVQIDTLTCTITEVETVILNAENFENYEWFNESGDLLSQDNSIRVNNTEQYQVKGIGSNGCSSDISFSIPIDTSIAQVDGVPLDTALNCRVDSIVVDFTSSGSFALTQRVDNGPFELIESSIIIKAGGVYQYVANYKNGCTSDFEFTVEDERSDSTLSDQELTLTCELDSFILDSQLDTLIYKLSWQGRNLPEFKGGSPIVRDSGTYSFLGINQRTFCEAKGVINVFSNRNDPLEVIAGDTIVTCTDSIANFDVLTDPNAIVTWTDPNGELILSPSVSTSTSGLYNYRIDGSNGCSITGVWNVAADNTHPLVDIPDTSFITCNLTSINYNLDTEGLSEVSWTIDDQIIIGDQIEITQESEIELSLTGLNGCSTIRNLSVLTDIEAPIVTVDNSDTVFCTPQTILLSSSTSSNEELSYNWSLDGNSISVDPELITNDTGSFVLLSEYVRNGCSTSDSVYITLSEFPLIGMEVNVLDESCIGLNDGSIDILNVVGGVEPISILVNNQTIDLNSIEDLGEGVFEIIIEDAAACRIDTTVTILEGDALEVSLGTDITVPFNSSFELLPIIEGEYFDIDWFINGQSAELGSAERIELIAIEDQEIILQALTNNGCVFRDTMNVDAVFTLENINMFIPNAFVAGQNNANGLLSVSLPDEIVSIDEFKIYDRYGALLHDISNPPGRFRIELWDGTYKGNYVNPGVYVYTCTVTTSLEGQKKVFTGNVTIMR